MTPHISVIGLVSADPSRTFTFYRRLGLDIPDDAASAPHVEVPLPGRLRIAFDTVETIRSFDPTYVHDATARGGPSLAFDCGTPDGVDAMHAELLTVGGTSTLSPFDAFWGQRYATLTDPDGNHVDLGAPPCT